MCGRYLLTSPIETVMALLGLTSGETRPYPPRFNIAPSQPVLVARRRRAGAFVGGELALMRWGLIPSWSKGPDARYSMINARAESLAERPAYRNAFRHRRCVLPANGYYEWRAEGKGAKQPYLMARRDGGLMLLAGLWESWQSPDGSEIDSVAIITRQAPPELRHIHDRAPVIFSSHEVLAWMNGTAEQPELERLMASSSAAELTARPVHPRVSNPANDDPSCLEAPPAMENFPEAIER